MPKKNLKVNGSKIVITKQKNKLFKASNKHSTKFVVLDGNNEKTWTNLKTKLGYETDSLFLEYLLDLANKDLHSCTNDQSEENAQCQKRRVRNKYILPNEVENGGIQPQYNEPVITQSEAGKKQKEKKKKTKLSIVENSSGTNSTENLIGRTSESIIDGTTEEENSHTAQTIKTEVAKDIGLDYEASDVQVESWPGKEVSPGLIEDKSMLSRMLSEAALQVVIRSESARTGFGGEECKENGEKRGARQRVAIKIKLCSQCNTRHVVGKCPLQSVDGNAEPPRSLSPEDTESRGLNDAILKRVSESIKLWNKENKNVYDFDDEKDVSVGDDRSNSWYPKRLKSVDSEDGHAQSEEPGEVKMGEDSDSDSSGSGQKLRIDESVSLAHSTLPEGMVLKVVEEEHGPGVFTKQAVACGTEFGPLVGRKTKEMDIPDDVNMRDIWEISEGGVLSYLSTQDPDRSNWLRFLRPGPVREASNLLGFVQGGELSFNTTRDIAEGEELLYWIDDTSSAWAKKKLQKKNCGGCNIQFAHPLYYRKHCMLFHDPTCSLTMRKYHCKVCGLAVLGKEKIMKHAADMHQGKGAYQCQFCLKFFLRLNYLEMHRTYGCSKNPQRSRPLCDLCGRKFCQPQKLKVHMKRMHSDIAEVLKMFQCKSCLKVLGSRAALQRHMKEVHSKDIVGACTCDRCGKMFQNKSNLKIHMLTHSGVKPFKCQQEDCSSAFTTKQCLQLHYKKIHGFAEGFIPKIERSIAYTFDAYSGGAGVEAGQARSPRVEEPLARVADLQSSCGLDLSMVLPPAAQDRDETHASNVTSPLSVDCGVEDTQYVGMREETEGREGEEEQGKGAGALVASKGSKKWLGVDVKFKPSSIFRHDNANASLLVEAAISAAEKDIIVKSDEEEVEKDMGLGGEQLMETPAEIYSIHTYMGGSPGVIYDQGEKPDESPKKDEGDALLQDMQDIPKDYNISSIIREPEAESFTDIEIQEYRNRDLLDGYSDPHRPHDLCRPDKLDLYRSDSELRLEYRDVDLSTECYRSLASGLDKYRLTDVYGARVRGGESYDLAGYRDAEERDGEVQNLCLKEKALHFDLTYKQYETLEELARLGRDSSGLECLVVGDSAPSMSQALSVAVPRGLHGMLSPRSYHPPSYDAESVDLSVPRPSYPSPPIYTLDLTPTRIDIPSARHIDLRNHLGLSPHRFPSARVTVPVVAGGSAQLSPPSYGVYPSPYVAPATRPSPTPQFHHYTGYY